ncbi:MAG TPA: spore germination protein [Symbiobacteriaceae bacterium]|nr:spore germination protein [Symbiobacteriaceae bacterium]
MAPSIGPELQRNVEAIQQELGGAMDLIVRPFTTGQGGGRPATLICFDGLANGQEVSNLMEEATRLSSPPYDPPTVSADPLAALKETLVRSPEAKITSDLTEVVVAILSGQTALLMEGSPQALLVDTRYNPARDPEEPQTETEVRGPRDGFVENLITNLTLIRRRIRDPKLRFEALQVGTRTRTDIAVGYIKDLADPGVVDEVRRRIQSVVIDGILESGELEELIQDSPLSPFSTLHTTERPDRVAASLLAGQVVILTDNTPFVLIAPMVFWHLLHAPGDYYNNFMVGTTYRFLRLAAVVVALILPSLYVILTTFHHEMIPTPLALSVAGGREGTPLPTLMEVLLMEVMFEILQEAGLRLPRAVGQTVSIVGALVIGEAAVQAGLVAPATVIVTASAGITSFAIPVYSASQALRILRFPLLLLSGVLGVFGFISGIAFLAMHLCSLRSFGAPYLAPLMPLQAKDLRDSLWRSPFWLLDHRQRFSREKRSRRQGPGQMPKPTGGQQGGGP